MKYIVLIYALGAFLTYGGLAEMGLTEGDYKFIASVIASILWPLFLVIILVLYVGQKICSLIRR